MALVSIGSFDRQTTAGPGLVIPTTLCVALTFLLGGNLGYIPLLNLGARSAPLFLSDAGVMVVVLLGGIAALRAHSLQLNAISMAAIVFACLGAISAVAVMPTYGFGPFELVASLAYLARWIVYFALYLVVINFVRDRDVPAVWRSVELTIVALAAFGIVQAAFLPDFGPMMRPDDVLYAQVDPQGHRLVSTILEPNITAAMILVVLLVQIAQLAHGVRLPWWKPSLLFVALLLTMSRSGGLAFFCGVLLILSVRGVGKRLLKFSGIATVLFLAALPAVVTFFQAHSRFGVSDSSAMSRLLAWQRAINVWVDHLWFGIGFNTYGFVQEARGMERIGSSSYSSEGGLLFIGVMTGIVGLALYVAMVWMIMRRCRLGWTDSRALPEERGLCLGVGAATLAVLIHSVFVNSLLANFVMEEMWVLWGLVFVVTVAIRRRTAISPA